METSMDTSPSRLLISCQGRQNARQSDLETLQLRRVGRNRPGGAGGPYRLQRELTMRSSIHNLD